MEIENSAVSNFREYVRIKSVHPDPDYESCVLFLKKQSKELDAEFQVTECIPGQPVVLLTIKGSKPDLQSIFLNSHMDVVPVFEEHWIHPPFSAHKDKDGNIYGRGTQDMKCVGVQYLEAMKRFKKANISLLRTVHICFVPDEEVGGFKGMAQFVKTKQFKDLNVGFALDEGYASENDSFLLFYGERNPWQFWVKCPGQPGHGSQFLPNNAGKKIQKVINSLMNFRDSEEQRLKNDPKLALGDVTTVNMTMAKGGIQWNVVPSELYVSFDIRVPPTMDLAKFEIKLKQWIRDAGDDVTLEFHQKTMEQSTTCVKDGENVWWDTFSAACKKESVQLVKTIFPAATDCRYLRDVGIAALGFSPMNNTPLLLHDHNEFLNEKIFLRGIEIYETIIRDVANLD